MEFPFWKMHGAGNDFILIDDRQETFPAQNSDGIAALCRRSRGIGSDGLTLLRPSTEADFRMVFFNPDGRPAAMCGNSARCAARLAFDLGLAPASMRIETDARIHQAEILDGNTVRLSLPPARGLRTNLYFSWEGEALSLHFVDSGVPHAILFVEDVQTVDVPAMGCAIRQSPHFDPEGSNADFVQIVDDHTLNIRTYERGVEAETDACGTGAVAAAVLAAEMGFIVKDAPVALHTRGGDILTVTLDPLTLSGPAEYVFTGTLTI